jgi:hypothetical protein
VSRPLIMMAATACKSCEADQQQLNPPASQRQHSGVHWQALARQQSINLF